jgi:hypothetical protein
MKLKITATKSSFLMHLVSEDNYESNNGHTLKREYGLSPNGNSLNGKWVLRNPDGSIKDFNQYLNDLIEHYNIKLEIAK